MPAAGAKMPPEPAGEREVTSAGGWGTKTTNPTSISFPDAKPMTGVAVQIIDSLRVKHRVQGRTGSVAVGLSLETGTCEVNHVVCGEWGWYKGPGSAPPMKRGDVIT